LATGEHDLNELAIDVSAAISKARRLDLPASAYILSMVPVEVSQLLSAVPDESKGDTTR
jgi:hypothetical protein